MPDIGNDTKLIKRKGRQLMTLEKLLIFGFALAALFAITTVGSNMMADRGAANEQYEGEIDNLTNSGF